MGKIQDLSGQKFNLLTVLSLAQERGPNRAAKWICQCDCGNIITVNRGDLIRTDGKATKSCGCLKNEKDLTNQRFGKLVALYKNENKKWVCQCDCGKYICVNTQDLTRTDNKATKSCGCSRSVNEIGNRYGKLTVISKDLEYSIGSADGTHWICQCDCGNKISYSGSVLRRGSALSCGCMKSKGEEKIMKILNSYNINYQKEFTFPNLKDKSLLRFDFAIFNKNNQLICLIEYQGEQHYKQIGFYKDVELFNQSNHRDNLKRKYCLNNNIPLLEINYNDYDKINILYLLSRMEKVINNGDR